MTTKVVVLMDNPRMRERRMHASAMRALNAQVRSLERAREWAAFNEQTMGAYEDLRRAVIRMARFFGKLGTLPAGFHYRNLEAEFPPLELT